MSLALRLYCVQVPDINDTWTHLVWTPPFSDPGDHKFENLKPIAASDLEYEVCRKVFAQVGGVGGLFFPDLQIHSI